MHASLNSVKIQGHLEKLKEAVKIQGYPEWLHQFRPYKDMEDRAWKTSYNFAGGVYADKYESELWVLLTEQKF